MSGTPATVTLYAAPTGSALPDMAVNAGIFVVPWPKWWRRIGRCEVSLAVTASRAELRIDVIYPDFQPAGPWSTPGVPTMLGWEAADGTARTICPKATYNHPIYSYDLQSTVAVPAMTINCASGIKGVVGGSPPTLVAGGPTVTYTAGGVAPLSQPRTHRQEYTGDSVDLAPGQLRGYREWKILAPDWDTDAEVVPPRLASITANKVWPPTPVVEAHCHRNQIIKAGYTAFDPMPEHDADLIPYGPCSCGIYAKHKPFVPSRGGDRVFGVIETWGKTEIGDFGLRARYARLVALAGPVDPFLRWVDTIGSGSDEMMLMPTPVMPTDTLDRLGQLYRVPVFDSQRELLDAYPPCDVSALLPEPEPEPWIRCACGMAVVRSQLRNHICRPPFNQGGHITSGSWVNLGRTHGGGTFYYSP